MSNAMTTTGEQAISAAGRLREIEYEIQFHVKRAAGHLLEIGRCLNAAKDERLVSHGEWQAWVETNTGMSARSAQRVMLAAREVPADSALAQLEFSKVQTLLALPAGEREDFAAENDAQNKSVRELEAAVKAKIDAEKRAAEAEKALRKLDQSIDQLADQRAKLTVQQAQADAAATIAGYQERIDAMNAQLTGKADAIAALRNQLQDAKTGSGVSAEAQARIDALQAEIDSQEEEIARQSKLRADAQAELLRARSQAARGGAVSASVAERLTADDLGAAVQAFIGRASVLPYMGAELAGLPDREHAAYRKYVDLIADWCESSRAALDTVKGGVICG